MKIRGVEILYVDLKARPELWVVVEAEMERLQAEIKDLRTDLAGFEAGAQEEANAGDEARAEVTRLQEQLRHRGATKQELSHGEAKE